MKNHISIKDGFNFLNKSKIKAGDGLSEGDFPFYTSSSIQSKFLNDYEIEDESLIFGTGGSASIHYSKGKFSTSTDCFVIQSNNKYEIDLKYVYFYLFGNIHLLENGFKGAGLKHISKKYLEEIKIPLVPLETQKKIVEALDKAQALIDARKEQIRLMDELVKARFVEMFGDPKDNLMKWPVHNLDELCKVGSSKRIYQDEQTADGIPFLRISDLMNRIETGNENCNLFIPVERFEELKSQGLVPKVGDILVTSRGTLGACYIVKETDCFYFQDGMISWLYQIEKSLIPLYISYLFKMKGFLKQIDNLQAGSTVAYLSIAMIKKLKIMLPPTDLQNEFEAFVKGADKSKFEMQTSLNELITTYQALMQQYFG